MTSEPNDAFERAAQREADARRERRMWPCWAPLLVHARIYVVVNAALFVIWVLETVFSPPEPVWFVDVLWGWGIGLLIHYLVVTQITGRWIPPRRSRRVTTG